MSKLIRINIQSDELEIEVEDDATPDEIENLVGDTVCSNVSYDYEEVKEDE